MELDLSVEIAGLKLKNPVMNASGTYDPLRYESLVDPNLLGAVVLKSLTLNPREGNPPPRIVEVACGIVNSIGIQNEGVEEFIKVKVPLLRKFKEATFIASVAGLTPNEFAEVVEALEGVDIFKAYEINTSCPNLEKGGVNCALDERCIQQVTKAVRGKTNKPVIVKLAPDVTDIVAIAKVAVDAGADALTIANTYRALVVDLKSRKPILHNVTGGLSGPAIKPITLRLVYEVVKALDVPVIASGGITSANDALEYLLVGAKAVQIGTMNFVRHDIMIKIIEGIKKFMVDEGIKDIKEFIGTLRT
ncbi:MAG: dihydroorotate dehydrogenase B catalytic subunit [Zestosphaera tikiterensis]|uniref:Dihydroorotate dehydrogenase n=1 Tax=Zestosphaera tikiterensis TaxID=1973259 RepID=A0A2R7YAX2_9CREN|nr:MAG: dihydroorotate dehydrogenase B catalytic subunit [Zestosphaera tikiterensis]